MIRVTLTSLCIVGLLGCASQQHPPKLLALDAAEPIRIETMAGSTDAVSIDSTGEAARSGALTGAGKGAAGGAAVGLQASIVCGPFILFCAAPLAVFAAAAGLVGGVVVGGIAGSLEGIPAQDAQALEQSLITYFEAQPIQTTFGERFTQAAGRIWKLDDDASTTVNVLVASISTEVQKDDRVGFRITAHFSVSYPPVSNDSVNTTKLYEINRDTQALTASEWSGNSAAAIQEHFNRTYGELIAAINSLLQHPPLRFGGPN